MPEDREGVQTEHIEYLEKILEGFFPIVEKDGKYYCEGAEDVEGDLYLVYVMIDLETGKKEVIGKYKTIYDAYDDLKEKDVPPEVVRIAQSNISQFEFGLDRERALKEAGLITEDDNNNLFEPKK